MTTCVFKQNHDKPCNYMTKLISVQMKASIAISFSSNNYCLCFQVNHDKPCNHMTTKLISFQMKARLKWEHDNSWQNCNIQERTYGVNIHFVLR